MTEVVLLFAELTSDQGHAGLGFSYSKRAGGPAQYAHAKEIASGITPSEQCRAWTVDSVEFGTR